MSSFFNVGALGGNPFSTPVGQRIENATDSALTSENWALYMEICDLVNESSDTARDAMKAIRKRLANSGKNFTVIIYTLTVLETCVKNCGRPFHVLVSQKEFINELVKLIGPKNDPPAFVQGKVLMLIQIWAEAFRSQPDLSGVVQVYSELKNKGIEFPNVDPDLLVPIYTPQRSVPETSPIQEPIPTSPQHHLVAQHPSANPNQIVAGAGPIVTTPEQIAKIQSELDIVTMNMAVLGEMLSELKPGQEDPSDYKLLTELSATCHEMQGRIVELIGRISHDEITAELLRLNDELNNLFLRHQRYEKNRDPTSAPNAGPAALLGAAMGVPTSTDNPKDSLIDFNDEASGDQSALSSHLTGLAIGTTSAQLSNINSVSAQSGKVRDVDEFDMLAQSRNTNSDAVPKTSQTSSAANTPKKEGAANSNDTEFDEMAAWLDKEIVEEEGPEESLTSKEFDRFLAERAAAADNLPTITSQTGSTTSSTARPKKNKEEDSLMAL